MDWLWRSTAYATRRRRSQWSTRSSARAGLPPPSRLTSPTSCKSLSLSLRSPIVLVVDVLVLNATGPQPEAPLPEVNWQDHLAQLEFFVKSPVLLGRCVLSGMQARRWGRIIQIDSEVVDRIPAGRSAYVTAKSAQIGLTRSWARELAPLGVTVNTVAPGFVPVERHADVPAEIRSAYLSSVPAGRMGTPEDIAQAVSFFASEAAGFVTGQRLVVDGGRGLS